MNVQPIAAELLETARSVAIAVLPLAAFFALLQTFVLRLPRNETRRIAAGVLLVSVGLVLFLVGIAIAFLPFGRATGEAIAKLPLTWMLPIGAVLGFATTWGEPAVRILSDQVEEASGGSLRRTLVLTAICVGVAMASGLGLLRIGYDVPLPWLLVPGYGLALLMATRSDPGFLGIALDAGGVATGPLANSFLLALALGTSSALGGQDPLQQGLGLVALVALAPILSVMGLGFFLRRKEREP